MIDTRVGHHLTYLQEIPAHVQLKTFISTLALGTLDRRVVLKA